MSDSDTTAQRRFIRCQEGHVFDANATAACPVCGAPAADARPAATRIVAAEGQESAERVLDKTPTPPRRNYALLGASFIAVLIVAGGTYWYLGRDERALKPCADQATERCAPSAQHKTEPPAQPQKAAEPPPPTTTAGDSKPKPDAQKAETSPAPTPPATQRADAAPTPTQEPAPPATTSKAQEMPTPIPAPAPAPAPAPELPPQPSTGKVDNAPQQTAPAPNPAPAPVQPPTPLERVEAVAAALKALRTAPLPAGFSAWTGGRAPVAADLPEGARTLTQVGGIGTEALGAYLRMEASQAPTPDARIRLLEQAFLLGETPAAAFEIAELLKASDPVRAFAFAREAGDRGVVAADGLAIALSSANPLSLQLPRTVRERFYQRSNASVKEASAGLDTAALPEPTYALCNSVLNKDADAMREREARAKNGDLYAAGCFTTALLVDFNNPRPSSEPLPVRPYAALILEANTQITPPLDTMPGLLATMAGDFAMGAGGGAPNPAEAAVWFLRAASVKPDVSVPNNEAPAVARYAEAMASLRPPVSDAVAVVLDPLRAAIVSAAPPPQTARRLDIGIEPYPVPAKLAADNGLAGGQGALIGRFTKDSAAEAQGLLVGDIVTVVNGQPVASVDKLPAQVEEAPAGQPIAIDFIRNGQRRSLRILATPKQVTPTASVPPPPQPVPQPAPSATPGPSPTSVPSSQTLLQSGDATIQNLTPAQRMAAITSELDRRNSIQPTWRKAVMPAVQWARRQYDRPTSQVLGAVKVTSQSAGMMLYLSGIKAVRNGNSEQAAVQMEAGYALDCTICGAALATILDLDPRRMTPEPDLSQDWNDLASYQGVTSAASALIDLPPKDYQRLESDGGTPLPVTTGTTDKAATFMNAYRLGDGRAWSIVERARAGERRANRMLWDAGVLPEKLPAKTIDIVASLDMPATEANRAQRAAALDELTARAGTGDAGALVALGSGRFTDPAVAFSSSEKGRLLYEAARRGDPLSMAAFAKAVLDGENPDGFDTTDAAVYAFAGWCAAMPNDANIGIYKNLTDTAMDRLAQKPRRALASWFNSLSSVTCGKAYR